METGSPGLIHIIPSISQEKKMEVEREAKRERREEKNLVKLKTESLERKSNKDEHQSLKPLETQRGIKCKGGYGPPPRLTEEEQDALFAKQCNMRALAGLELLNKGMANGVHYELVMAHSSTFFRTNEGWRFHCNFLAKIADDPNAETRLFFVFLKFAPIDFNVVPVFNSVSSYEAIHCVDLGPIDTDSERCRSCKICKEMDMSCPNFHPLRSDIIHSCELCELDDPAIPIFHPPGLKVDHLQYGRKTSTVTAEGEKL